MPITPAPTETHNHLSRNQPWISRVDGILYQRFSFFPPVCCLNKYNRITSTSQLFLGWHAGLPADMNNLHAGTVNLQHWQLPQEVQAHMPTFAPPKPPSLLHQTVQQCSWPGMFGCLALTKQPKPGLICQPYPSQEHLEHWQPLRLLPSQETGLPAAGDNCCSSWGLFWPVNWWMWCRCHLVATERIVNVWRQVENALCSQW